MATDLIHGKPTFHYNPFGGISDTELNNIILPKFDLGQIADQLRNDKQPILQFVGKKGRGKTTHLRMLSHLLKEADLFLLNSTSTIQEINQSAKSILLIDSIHHIPLSQRIQLFKRPKAILITAHWSKRLEFLLAGRPHKTYYFKGIDTEKLNTILENRIALAIDADDSFSLNPECLQQLIRKHGDHYRGILNDLYNQFQTHYEPRKRNIRTEGY